jgi:hypothetical protein
MPRERGAVARTLRKPQNHPNLHIEKPIMSRRTVPCRHTSGFSRVARSCSDRLGSSARRIERRGSLPSRPSGTGSRACELLTRGLVTQHLDTWSAKDANLRAIFIERTTINDPEGAPVGDGSNLLAYLPVPTTNPEGDREQLVIGGITHDAADAPGPLGVYLQATTDTLLRTTNSGPGPIVKTQDWAFKALSGEHPGMHTTFERGVGNRRAARDTRFYSASNPTFYEISRQQQVLDILQNVTTNPTDRVRDFSFTAGGGSYGGLFDGAEKVLSWDNIVSLNREIFVR